MRCGNCKWFSGPYKCMSNDKGLAKGWCNVPVPASFTNDCILYSYWVCERTETNCPSFRRKHDAEDDSKWSIFIN